jgi:hypothetical protein
MRSAAPAFAVLLALASAASAALAPDVEKALRDSTYVYVQSERKSGEWSKPAEIWFHYEDGKVYVATRPSSWRVRRIGWKRTKARIAVGKSDGPAFEATGALVKDPALEQRLMDDYAKKYSDRFPKYAQDFRDGFKSGERVVVRYTPK